MSTTVSHTGAEVHRVRWVVEGFVSTAALVVLMMLFGPAVVVAFGLGAAFLWAEWTR